MITLEQVKEKEQAAATANSELRDIRMSYAHQECPLKIGEVVECLGWNHNGKKMRINYIGNAKYSSGGYWMVSGVVLKKDGSDSKFNGDFDQSDYENHLKNQG